MPLPNVNLPAPRFEANGEFARLLLKKGMPQTDFYNLLQKNVDFRLADIRTEFRPGHGTVGPRVTRPPFWRGVPGAAARGLLWAVAMYAGEYFGEWAGEEVVTWIETQDGNTVEGEIAECLKVVVDVQTEVFADMERMAERKQLRRRRRNKDPRKRVRIWGYSRCN